MRRGEALLVRAQATHTSVTNQCGTAKGALRSIVFDGYGSLGKDVLALTCRVRALFYKLIDGTDALIKVSGESVQVAREALGQKKEHTSRAIENAGQGEAAEEEVRDF